jgi:hypothetical protein
MQPDWIDRICNDWAIQRRKSLGIILGSKMEPRERLGKIRSTLGAVREEGEGAAYSTVSQNWPEVYTGTNLLVHRCWYQMIGPWKEVMHMQYVWRELPFKERHESIQMSSTVYCQHLNRLKPHVDGYLKCHDDMKIAGLVLG